MVRIWDLPTLREVPPCVELDTGGYLPQGLDQVLGALQQCGLDSGHVLLSLLTRLGPVDPLGLWQLLYQGAEDFPDLVRGKDGHPDRLFADHRGYYPFGEVLHVDTGKGLPAYEGILCLYLFTPRVCFYRQTAALRIECGAQPHLLVEDREGLYHLQGFYNGSYFKVWELAPDYLETMNTAFSRLPEATLGTLRAQFYTEQLRAGMRHAREQWRLEAADLQKPGGPIPSPSDYVQAQDVLHTVLGTKSPDRSNNSD